jgi:hypothetical protein
MPVMESTSLASISRLLPTLFYLLLALIRLLLSSLRFVTVTSDVLEVVQLAEPLSLGNPRQGEEIAMSRGFD